MHYYQHHIGDFIRDTSRLTDQQCMTYLRLIWMYYESEKPLPDNAASLALRVGSDEQTVSLILSAFFTRSDGNWIQMRCESEIRKFQKKADSARHANDARWSKTDTKTDLKSDVKTDANQVSEQIPTNNQQPITNNQQPIQKKGKRAAFPCPVGVDEQVWSDWLEIRKAKRSPLTQTALDGIEKRALEAGYTLPQALVICCERNWASFNPSWLHENKAGNTGIAETNYQRSMRLRMQEAVPQIAAVDPSIPAGDFFRTIEMVEVVR